MTFTAFSASIPLVNKGSWTEEENLAIVEDYFAMLSDELAGRPYNKASHRSALRKLISRSEGSVEFKHQNISAVLAAMGETWINGYKPAFKYQSALEDIVARRLDRREDRKIAPPELDDAPMAWTGKDIEMPIAPPPTQRNAPPPQQLEKALATARKFDVAARDEKNRKLGREGERRALAHERAVLRREGRDDLATQVRWVSEEDGDGLGFDIKSYEPDGAPRLLEVKTTNGGWEWTPFHISRNELAVAERHRASWVLFRVWDMQRTPKAFEIRPPLEAHVNLTATSFQATFH